MGKLPQLRRARDSKYWHNTAWLKDGVGWLPARSLPFVGNPVANLMTRLKLAIGVFMGKYDALSWEDHA